MGKTQAAKFQRYRKITGQWIIGFFLKHPVLPGRSVREYSRISVQFRAGGLKVGYVITITRKKLIVYTRTAWNA